MHNNNEPPNSHDFTDIRRPPCESDDPRDPTNAGVDRLLDVNGAARMLNVTRSWVYEHTRPDCQDRLPAIKLGKYVRFDRRDLDDYIEQKRDAVRLRRGNR
jgi:excisionase family DNA binding protein